MQAVYSEELVPSDITTLNNVLVPKAFNDWKELGKKLQFKDEQIDWIESHVDCSQRCYFGVMKAWLDGKPFTIERVFQLGKALLRIGETEVAKKLIKLPPDGK